MKFITISLLKVKYNVLTFSHYSKYLLLFRIMLLNLLNLYSLIFALFNKIEGMSKDLDALKPVLNMNASTISNSTLNLTASVITAVPTSCIEEEIHCSPCSFKLIIKMSEKNEEQLIGGSMALPSINYQTMSSTSSVMKQMKVEDSEKKLIPENLEENPDIETSTLDSISIGIKELEKLRELTKSNISMNITSEIEQATIEDYYENTGELETTTLDTILLGIKELERLRKIILVQRPLVFKEATPTTEENYNYTLYESSVDTSSSDVTEKSISNYDASVSESSKSTTDFASTEDGTFSSIPNYLNSDLTTIINNFSNSSVVTRHETDITEATTETNFPTDITHFSAATNEQTVEFEVITTTSEINPTMTTDITVITSKPNPIGSTIEEKIDIDITTTSLSFETDFSSSLPTITSGDTITKCPNVTFNCTLSCNNENITQIFYMSNCNVVDKVCYVTRCKPRETISTMHSNYTNTTVVDIAYMENNRKIYNLTRATKKKLLKLCWETMFGQELVKLTMMDLVRIIMI